MISAIALLACGAVMVVEEVGDVPAEERAAILAELEAAFREAAGVSLTPIADRSLAPPHEDLVTVTLFGGPLRIRCIAERTFASAPDKAPAHAETDLVRGAHTWRPKLDDLVLRLFPRPGPSAAPAAAVQVRPGPEEEPERFGHWIFFGAGAVALGTGIFFGASSRSALDELQSTPLGAAEYRETADRAAGHAVAANILIIAGLVSSLAGALLVIDE